jgi:NhaA family Na+:H+ antiporter
MLVAARREAWSAVVAAADQEPLMSAIPLDSAFHGLVAVPTRSLHRFVATEARSAMLVLATTATALIWASSPWVASYDSLWSTTLSVRVGDAELAKDLRRWVNDGLMVLFFLVLGLEATRGLTLRRLRHPRALMVPAAVALGGLIAPALVYLAFTVGSPAASGWGIVLAGDLALGLGILALAGRRCPPQLRVLLLEVLLVGNLAAITIVTLQHADAVNLLFLAVVAGLLALLAVVRRLRILRTLAYLTVAIASWLAAGSAGINPALVGLLLAVALAACPPLPVRPVRVRWFTRPTEPDWVPGMSGALEPGDGEATPSPARLQQRLHPWSAYLVVPLFALANAGVPLDRDTLAGAVSSPIARGVLAGLVVGKLAGVFGTAWLAVRTGLGALPRLATDGQLAAAGVLAGVGFTVALLVADLAVTDPVVLEQAKIAILLAAALAGLVGWLLLWMPARLPRNRRTGGAQSPVDGATGAGR